MLGDFEKVTLPFSLAIGDEDNVTTIAQTKQAKAVLDGKRDVDTEVTIYPGARHKSSVRASRSEPNSKEIKQAEEAEKQAISWFQKHLKR